MVEKPDAKHTYKFPNPVLAHWCGSIPLLPTIFITLLALSYGLGFIPVQNNLIYAVLIVALLFAILTWQLVGTWRAVSQDQRAFGHAGTAWLAYAAMLVSITMTLIHGLSHLSGNFSKQQFLQSITALPKLPVSGDTATIHGDIDFDTIPQLQSVLDVHPAVTRIVINSDGGLIVAARVLAAILQEKKRDTHVSQHCHSACTLVFMAGNRRTMAHDARIGFHQYRFQKPNPLNPTTTDREQLKDIAYFRSRGVNEDFLSRAFDAKHDAMWFPSAEALFDAGVLTAR